MASYDLRYKTSFYKDLRKIDHPIRPKLLEASRGLAIDPFPHHAEPIQGSDQTYRLRVGEYRMIYQVDTKAKVVTVYHARRRTTTTYR